MDFANATLAQLKTFAQENAIAVEGDKRLRATWEKAVKLFLAVKTEATAIAQETVEGAEECLREVFSINTLDTALEVAEELYHRADRWRESAAEVDMWEVAGRYLGTAYSDYRKGLRYIKIMRKWLMAVIDAFVESCEEQTEINHAIALCLVASNQAMLNGVETSSILPSLCPFQSTHPLESLRVNMRIMWRWLRSGWRLKILKKVMQRLGTIVRNMSRADLTSRSSFGMRG